MFTRARLKPLLYALGLVLAGCSSAPSHDTPQLPPDWFHGNEQASLEPSALAHWWDQFDDPMLTATVTRAMQANYDARLAMLRVQAARAQLRQARASLFPILDLPGSASRQWIDVDPPASARPQLEQLGLDLDDGISIDMWELALQASWEPDIFGANRARTQGARQQVRSAQAQAIGARLSVAAGAAQGYIRARTLEAQLALLEEGQKIAGEFARISSFMFEAGEVTRLDVEASAAEHEALAAQHEQVQIALAEARLALDTLLARPPGTTAEQMRTAPPSSVPVARAAIAPGQPIDLLRRRPDLIAAAADLQGAELQSLAARRDLFPKIAVQAAAGRSGFALGDAISSASNFARLGATFALPLLDYPRRQAAIELADVSGEQAFVSFQQTLAEALEDVERALVNVDGQRRRQIALGRTLAHRERAHSMARRSYELGEANLAEVLDAQRSVLETRGQVIEARAALAGAQVALYLALGGGWQQPAPQAQQADR
ncbi:efflux transporter, outer membrane factor (OMF) lipoprotein, NodT family [Halopseudomonas xinjiangensis]|uniref:Efflux transporter, outer membrane factor (OMF) lipoprotein, NodT family n=1 Tax=Halopseudomonas xinjiangensis TaxID=487184 RepID=A0A1H1T5U3_9GAMM|nr:efflux transporter outer membrane subunit [Halopseudomonas xinjiangensis]SDS55376.1 efflux transporter, outer membrane factor (OMF) lipoprotein, NodT family [Halopseudomonas xinjiangensis]